jgi:hypothetical protein
MSALWGGGEKVSGWWFRQKLLFEQCSKPLLVDDYRKSYATTIPYAKLRIIMIIIQFQPTSTVELQLQIGTLFILNKPFEI